MVNASFKCRVAVKWAQLDTTTVAQAGSLLYRGLAIRRRADCQSAKRQIANLRHTRRTVRVGGGRPLGPLGRLGRFAKHPVNHLPELAVRPQRLDFLC
jgi:hypothetical protein